MSAPVKLGETNVGKIEPTPGTQAVVWDSEIKGYGVRVSPGGTKTFFIQGRIKGNPKLIKITLGKFGIMKAEQARSKARNLLNSMANGEDPRLAKETQETGHTFGDLMTAYVGMLEAAGKASASAVKSAITKNIEQAFPKLWKKPAAEITIDDCVAIVGKLNDEGSQRQADKIRSYIKTAYTKAINARGNVKAPAVMRQLRISHNPARDIEKVEGSTNASERALSLAEFRAYWKRIQTLDEPRRSVAMLHVLTGGQRMQQLARVTTADIDRDGLLMRMQDGKGRRAKPRVYSVPLLPQALQCIEAATGSGRYVFSSNGGVSPMHISYISDIVKTVCADMAEAGELEGEAFTGKVIRATIETRLMKAPYRVSSDVLARLLSHGLGGVQAKHYAHDPMHDEQVEALEKLWRLLEDQPEPSAQVYQMRASA